MPRHSYRPRRSRRKARSSHQRRPLVSSDAPARHEQLRWQHEARNVIPALETENAGSSKLQRLLISLAAFLEPASCQRLGARGVWGVGRAIREIAEAGTLRSTVAPGGHTDPYPRRPPR